MTERRLSDTALSEIRRLAEAGVGRNEIARQIGCSPTTVTRVAPPGSFDRSSTEIAVRAAQADHARKRSEVNTRLLAEIDAAIDRLRQPVTVRIAAGKEVLEFVDQQPGPRELRDLATAVAQLSAAHGRLAEVDARFGESERTEEALSILEDFGRGIRDRVALMDMHADGIDVDKYLPGFSGEEPADEAY